MRHMPKESPQAADDKVNLSHMFQGDTLQRAVTEACENLKDEA